MPGMVSDLVDKVLTKADPVFALTGLIALWGRQTHHQVAAAEVVLGVMEAAEATVGALGLGAVMGGFLEEAFQEGKDTAGGRYSPCEDPMVGGSLAPLKDREKPVWST